MHRYLNDEKDQFKAFLAGAEPAHSASTKEKEEKIRRDWENVGGDRAHVQSMSKFVSPMGKDRTGFGIESAYQIGKPHP